MNAANAMSAGRTRRHPRAGLNGARLLVLTDRRGCQAVGHELVDTVRIVAEAGAPFVVFREKDLERPARWSLAEQIQTALTGTPTGLLIASDVELAVHLGADGVHLAASDPMPGRNSTQPAVFGRSCHSYDDAAAADDVDYVTVSPFALTASKPGYGPALGTDALANIAKSTEVPVFALGGINDTNAAEALDAGAAGVAVMGAAMRAGDPAAAVDALLRQTEAR